VIVAVFFTIPAHATTSTDHFARHRIVVTDSVVAAAMDEASVLAYLWESD
jgi:hypothetical protein